MPLRDMLSSRRLVIGTAPFICLAVWVVLGFIFYFQIRGNYEHGRWEGVSVEDILYSKMLQDGKLPDGDKILETVAQIDRTIR